MGLHSRLPTHWRCIGQKGTSTWLEFQRHSTADRCMRDASQKDFEVAAGIEVVVVMDVCTPMHGREEGARGGGSGSVSHVAVNGIESAHGHPWMHWQCASRASLALAAPIGSRDERRSGDAFVSAKGSPWMMHWRCAAGMHRNSRLLDGRRSIW